MLALRRQRPRTGQAARSARSQTINPVPKPALQCFASHATHAARQNHSLGYLAPTPSDRTLRPNPHSSPHRHRPASRDFVPWRFLDAGRISTPKVSSLPASKNLTNSSHSPLTVVGREPTLVSHSMADRLVTGAGRKQNGWFAAEKAKSGRSRAWLQRQGLTQTSRSDLPTGGSPRRPRRRPTAGTASCRGC